MEVVLLMPWYWSHCKAPGADSNCLLCKKRMVHIIGVLQITVGARKKKRKEIKEEIADEMNTNKLTKFLRNVLPETL